MKTAIVNQRIAGTRISVHDVFYYEHRGRKTEEIASLLNITAEQIQAANEYIQAHRQEVWENYVAVEERNARGNPPEIRKKSRASRKKLGAIKAEIMKRKRMEPVRVGNSG